MCLLRVQVTFQATKTNCSSSTEYLAQPRPLHHDAQTNSETTNKRSYDTPSLLAKNREALVLYVVSLTLYSTLYSTLYYQTNSFPTYHTFHILYPFYSIRTWIATTQWSLHAVQSSVLRLQLSPSVPLPLPASLPSSSVADSSLLVAAMKKGLHPATYLGEFMFLLASNLTWFSNYV